MRFQSLATVMLVGAITFMDAPSVFVQEHSYYGAADGLAVVVADLKAIAANIIPRTAEGIHAGAGVCIDGAIVLDRALPHHERTAVGIRLAEFSDVHFTMDMTLKDQLIESDGLESQLKSGEEQAKAEGRGERYSQIKFLRRAERQVANWKGYAALVRRPSQGRFTSFHEFSFVSQGEPKNHMLPAVNLDPYTGVQDNLVGTKFPSLNDNEVIELWDRLTHSIRPNVSTSK